jgi:hypothetical protein
MRLISFARFDYRPFVIGKEVLCPAQQGKIFPFFAGSFPRPPQQPAADISSQSQNLAKDRVEQAFRPA